MIHAHLPATPGASPRPRPHQAELTLRAGVPRATVSRLENTRVSAVDLEVLEKLADLLRVEPGFLLSRTPSAMPARRLRARRPA